MSGIYLGFFIYKNNIIKFRFSKSFHPFPNISTYKFTSKYEENDIKSCLLNSFSQQPHKYDTILFHAATYKIYTQNRNKVTPHNLCTSCSICSPMLSVELEPFLKPHYFIFFDHLPIQVRWTRYHWVTILKLICIDRRLLHWYLWNFWRRLI